MLVNNRRFVLLRICFKPRELLWTRRFPNTVDSYFTSIWQIRVRKKQNDIMSEPTIAQFRSIDQILNSASPDLTNTMTSHKLRHDWQFDILFEIWNLILLWNEVYRCILVEFFFTQSCNLLFCFLLFKRCVLQNFYDKCISTVIT